MNQSKLDIYLKEPIRATSPIERTEKPARPGKGTDKLLLDMIKEDLKNNKGKGGAL